MHINKGFFKWPTPVHLIALVSPLIDLSFVWIIAVFLVELTIPFTRNIDAANSRKRIRYEFLANDLEAAGYKCSNLPLEVGSRGHLTQRNRETLTFLCHKFKIRKYQQIMRSCSKLALLGSYTIFNARSAPDWSGSGYLKPWFIILYTHIMSVMLFGGYYCAPHLKLSTFYSKLPCYFAGFCKICS